MFLQDLLGLLCKVRSLFHKAPDVLSRDLMLTFLVFFGNVFSHRLTYYVGVTVLGAEGISDEDAEIIELSSPPRGKVKKRKGDRDMISYGEAGPSNKRPRHADIASNSGPNTSSQSKSLSFKYIV